MAFFDTVLYPPLGYRLQLWQRKVLRDLYGTLKGNGLRQYRHAYLSVAKKNGKSFLLEAGKSIIMPANVPHAVNAVVRFKMLLTMIKETV